jgi:flagellar motor component MotA
MKKKSNSGQDTLDSIRRNSAYQSSRKLSLFFSVVVFFAVVIFSYFSSRGMIKSEQAIVLILAAFGGGLSAFILLHILHAHFDGSDALIQVAKFQERSLRKRNDALTMVEKIREEVEEEKKSESSLSATVSDENNEDKNKLTEEAKEPDAQSSDNP